MENDIKKILEKLDALERRMLKIEHNNEEVMAAEASGPTQKKKLSLREFLLSKNPNNDVKKTLVIGYYLEKLDGLFSFNISDLEAAFERAKETKPTNMNDKVNMNIRNGYMEEASEKKDSRKAWYLTNTGEAFVENDLKSQTKKS